MKITKFRAIDESTNNFVYGSLIQTTDPNVSYIIEPIDQLSDLSEGCFHKVVSTSISQFTNKHDRNKKPIYTGDIIVEPIKLVENERDPNPFTGYIIGIVEMMASGICVSRYVLHSHGSEQHNDIVISDVKSVTASKSTVIGNIFQSELIIEKYKDFIIKLKP